MAIRSHKWTGEVPDTGLDQGYLKQESGPLWSSKETLDTER